ncbi:MAG: hypothetical protein DMG57_44535 [Acidobacteria bacterium]|nr:MAG: hypothetical protein DMG57_44535 [Acidobacteriota bacterium]
MDDVSSFNVSASAPNNVAGENDLAQNPLNIRAEHGRSLFEARHRLTISGTYEMPRCTSAPRAARWLINDWQLNGIATASTGTPVHGVRPAPTYRSKARRPRSPDSFRAGRI